MRLNTTPIAGVMTLEVVLHEDERGAFARTYDEETFRTAGLSTRWPQCNTSWNPRRGTLRGMHFQAAPKEEPKLVRCTAGSIYDVALDLRPDSKTYLGWFGVELSADKRNALFIPPGIAHGFLTLADNAEVFYQMGEEFDDSLQRGVRWNDPAFDIAWPFEPGLISERDSNFADYVP